MCDPMCGGGSIPIEGALAFKQGFYFAGDFHEKAVERTKDNLKAFSNRIPSDGIQWDVTNIPLRDNCLDVLISDLVSKIKKPLFDLLQKRKSKLCRLFQSARLHFVHMFLPSLFLSKSFFTSITLEWFFSTVVPFMDFQIAQLNESFTTSFALMWFFICMKFFMPIVGISALESP